MSGPARDARLLDIYDLAAEATDNKASMPRRIAERLDGSEPGQFGNGADAIEKHLRRLLKTRAKERVKEAAAAAENERQWRVVLEEYETITKEQAPARSAGEVQGQIVPNLSIALG